MYTSKIEAKYLEILNSLKDDIEGKWRCAAMDYNGVVYVCDEALSNYAEWGTALADFRILFNLDVFGFSKVEIEEFAPKSLYHLVRETVSLQKVN